VKHKFKIFREVWEHAHAHALPRNFGKNCTLRLNLVAFFTEICKFSLNIATELKTYWSNDRLKISEGEGVQNINITVLHGQTACFCGHFPHRLTHTQKKSYAIIQ